MRKNFAFQKLVISSTLLLSLLLPSTSFAAGTGDHSKPSIDIPTQSQLSASMVKEQLLQEHKKKLKRMESTGITTRADLSYRTIAVTPFKQETNYWCGPATTKQMLHFINGSSQSQSYYAGKLGTTTDGTDFSLIDNVLNDHQSTNTYTYRDFTSSDFDTWKSIMILTIDWSKPAALDLKITSQNMPLYTSPVAGHILNNSGYDLATSDKRIRLTDPFDQGGRGVTHGNVWHPFEGVWKANQAHFRKAVIW